MIRSLTSALMVLLMAAFGISVYQYLGSLKSRAPAQRPDAAAAAAKLPGTLYLAQGGALYRLARGRFSQLTPAQGWTQPEVSPDGSRLVAVKRAGNSSDLYLLGLDGQVQAQLTHNGSSTVEGSHWAFYPRFSPDGSSVYYSFDPKDRENSYRVDLAIFALGIGSAGQPGRQWTRPNPYTGGDVIPTPLQAGSLLYAKYSIDRQGQVHSQLWIQARAGSPGLGLTRPEEDCSQPAVSRSQTLVAMVCRHGGATGDLVVAPLEAASYELGPERVVVGGQLVASPSFSPDGLSLAYFAPASEGGPFQLWTVAVGAVSPAASPPPSPARAPAPVLVTRNLSLDPAAGPAWI